MRALTNFRSRVRLWQERLFTSCLAEDGDVPGWVLITLMTAGLVVVIWATAGPALVQMFERAINSVTGPGM
ncbi:MAG: hypothetical protein Q3999_05895 [Buchananella hordeovulneris]|nr:hypothetical protein [Buchananella hordeovulneris]